MRGGRRDRLWMIGGAAGAVLLLAIGWFFLIGPKKAQTSSLNERTASAQVNVATLQHKLADLRRQNRDLSRYRARLAKDRQALPTTSDMSNFLRELQRAGDKTGVSVNALLVGAPTQVSGNAKVYALLVTLTARGSAATLDKFLDQLQQVQPRAVLITSASEAPVDQSGSLLDAATLTATMQVFVAPPTSSGPGKGEPATTTS